MNRTEKSTEVAALRESLGAAKGVVLTNFQGLNVAEIMDLRRHLRKASVQYKVVKNTLAVRAIRDGRLEGLAPHFAGPTGIAYSVVDPVAPARALVAWAKGRPTLAIKGGVLDGAMLGPADIAAVAALPGREAMLSRMLSVLQAPVRNLASVLHTQVRGLAAVLDQVRQQKEKAQ
jgi:large subunit ribosomal protein L10